MAETQGETRIERDSMGEMRVPKDALYGASTARAIENFPIAKRPLPPALIHAYGHLKAACAQANQDLGKLAPEVADAIVAAADEVAAGMHDAHFPVDVYQTGSGTSTNMNVNEVIATLATRSLGSKVHPNDHVNMGQSSNDTFPTAMHLAAALQLSRGLTPALGRLAASLAEKAERWNEIVKVGRTHLMDATPIRMSQVFEGYVQQASGAQSIAMLHQMSLCNDLPIGGTAVGTGINTHLEFAERVCEALEHRLGLRFAEASVHTAAQAAKDDFVQAHAQLKTIAIMLSKIASDIRLLGSGPRCGLGELILPATQPGSSIMPGKVNPVMCESVIQVTCRVIGNDATITTANLGGVGSILELNVAMPVMIDAFLESVTLLTNVTNAFTDKCIAGLEVNRERCEELVERSLMMVTALVPELGYDKAAAIAKRAMAEDKTIRELVLAEGLIDPARLDTLLDPRAMTEPSGSSGGG